MHMKAVVVCTLRRYAFIFFFSSRRRHTRLVSDWSSDVCSSDLASYLLSRTLVPTMVHHMLRGEVALHHGDRVEAEGLFRRLHRAMNDLFERLRYRYMGLLELSLDERAPMLIAFVVISFGSLFLVRLVGRDFFPDVDAGTLRLHARMAAGTRIEQTEVRFADIEQEIRRTLPPAEIDTILDNIGIPY